MSLIPKNTALLPTSCSIGFLFVEEINSMEYSTDQFHRWVVKKNSQDPSWRNIYFSNGSIEFTEVQKDDEAGGLFDQTLKFNFPGESESNNSQFDGLINRPLVVSINYANGMTRLIGSLENPARFTRSIKQDVKTHGSEFVCKCLSIEPTCWLRENPV